MLKARGGLVWLGMILAGLALSAYVVTVWPDTSPRAPVAAESMEVRRPASVRAVEASPQNELAGILGDVYPLELYFYEVSPSPLLDLLIATPQAADAS